MKTQDVARAMERQVGQQQAEILLGQIMMIQDPYLMGQIKEMIAAGQSAEATGEGIGLFRTEFLQ